MLINRAEHIVCPRCWVTNVPVLTVGKPIGETQTPWVFAVKGKPAENICCYCGNVVNAGVLVAEATRKTICDNVHFEFRVLT